MGRVGAVGRFWALSFCAETSTFPERSSPYPAASQRTEGQVLVIGGGAPCRGSHTEPWGRGGARRTLNRGALYTRTCAPCPSQVRRGRGRLRFPGGGGQARACVIGGRPGAGRSMAGAGPTRGGRGPGRV